MSLRTIKWEKEADGQQYNSADEGQGAAEHRERVREMTQRMAGGAGFNRGQLDGRMTGDSLRVEPHRETLPPSMKTPRYDGKANWEAFHAQFELLAQAGKWCTEEKALQLAMCLTGDALTSLLLLSPADRSDYDALVGALKRRFGLCSTASLLRSELCSRQRRHGELLRELANDIEGLVHRTYTHMAPVIQSELARDHFLQALLPAAYPDITGPSQVPPGGFGISQLCAGTRDAAVDITTQVRAARGAELSTEEPAWVEKLMQLVHATTLREERSPRTHSRVCWGCGQPGHLVRQCPRNPANQGNEPGTA